jgi:hypothetical protein
VQLTLTNSAIFVTDSAGVVAFYRDDLMSTGTISRQVWFSIDTPGYTYPPDGFGFHGFRPTVTPGGSYSANMQRVNVAERLYRVTGVDPYRDSALLGDSVLPMQDPSGAPVAAQPGGETVLYNNALFWMCNDTLQPDSIYPNDKATCEGATTRAWAFT